MTFFPEKLHVCILGAGPAGICAALRLLEMGHTVGMIESEAFPRQQIGESLSPTVRNIFAYLNAEQVLHHESYLHHLPSNVIWENKENVQQLKNRPENIVVDRSILDQQLLQLAVNRGLHLLQPAKLHEFCQTEEGWKLEVLSEGKTVSIQTIVLLDARGRKGTLAKERLSVSPASVATWTHIHADLMPEETFVEATREGWFWGAKVLGNRYRIMAFTDGKTIQQYKDQSLFELAKSTRFFSSVAGQLKDSVTETCSVTSFVHQNPWNGQLIKLGEAAFTLDPLSSNGVEKAMRFSLQAAIAVNTFLKDPGSSHAKAFYEEKLIDSVSNHAHWTASFYQTAWPYKENALFWKNKSVIQLSVPPDSSQFLRKLQQGFNSPPSFPSHKAPVSIPVDLVLNQIRSGRISPSPLITFKEVFAVNNDVVEVIQAVCHPGLERPVGYLEQLNLPLLLQEITGQTIEMAIELVNRKFSLEKGKKIIFHLWQNQLIVVN
ncbi:tryptophan 7-halogenase [Fluviicola sp.]|uniref:flavin-dependent monooxygenase QhpG n=1 Tax=Fluviicola sp. TaxID=1917219 RepID=UPI0026073289|nr:tryptophan 7-halogenase [Fluviicola sp.]